MANSKYEYVKSFELQDNLLPQTWLVVRIDGCHFHKFSQVHEFEKPNDERALHLLNECATAMLAEFPDIVFAYGVSDEYSFVIKKTSTFHQRRASKIVSLTVSFFSATYVMKWHKFFPHKELQYPPSFDGRVVCYPSSSILRDYLAWRQVDCHINNQYNTCFWMLVKSGKSTKEAQEFLKGTQTQEKNELLFQQFGINYNMLPAIFRKGSCVFKKEVDEVAKYNEASDPVIRRRKKTLVQHCDIIGDGFWNEHSHLLSDN
eukprot:Gb_05117 [translate_table: standard]